MALLILYAALAIGISFLCSMLEAALLSVPEGYLQALAEQGSRAGQLLKRMTENIDRPLTAILTVNTIANTAGAAGVGAQAAIVFGSVATGIATGAMTLSILIVSEIIPKTIGAVHSRGLARFTAFAVRAMVVVCLPLVVVVEKVKRRLGYEPEGVSISRLELRGTLRLGRETGALGQEEHHVISNVLALRNVRLSEVLTPRTVMFSLPEEMTAEEAISRYASFPFSRIPVYEDTPEHIAGYVPRFEIYRASIEQRGDQPLRELRRPILFLPELATVGDALRQMLAEGEHIALAVDEYGAIEGLVTLEDLLETLLGEEIVDETDHVADMRELARRKLSEDVE